MGGKERLAGLTDSAYISELNLAGSHDSAAAYTTFPGWATCQTLTISRQLSLGIRLLDLRLRCTDGKFFMVHSVADCFVSPDKKEKLTFDTVLDDCRAFLRDEPKETLVLSVKMDRGRSYAVFFRRFCELYVRGNEDVWYLNEKVPTLGEVRGKLVLMRRFVRPKHCGEDAGHPCGLDFSVWENQNSERPVPPFRTDLGSGCAAVIQDGYRLAGERKWSEAVLPFLETQRPSESKICLNCLSTAGGRGLRLPAKNAAVVNAAFSAYPLSQTEPQGWFLLDFPTQELVDKISDPNLHFAR